MILLQKHKIWEYECLIMVTRKRQSCDDIGDREKGFLVLALSPIFPNYIKNMVNLQRHNIARLFLRSARRAHETHF